MGYHSSTLAETRLKVENWKLLFATIISISNNGIGPRAPSFRGFLAKRWNTTVSCTAKTILKVES
jgi:hypothetical protein